MITPPVYSIRDQEGVGHVCVESFPLVKGFRIVEGEKEEEEEEEGWTGVRIAEAVASVFALRSRRAVRSCNSEHVDC